MTVPNRKRLSDSDYRRKYRQIAKFVGFKVGKGRLSPGKKAAISRAYNKIAPNLAKLAANSVKPVRVKRLSGESKAAYRKRLRELQAKTETPTQYKGHVLVQIPPNARPIIRKNGTIEIVFEGKLGKRREIYEPIPWNILVNTDDFSPLKEWLAERIMFYRADRIQFAHGPYRGQSFVAGELLAEFETTINELAEEAADLATEELEKAVHKYPLMDQDFPGFSGVYFITSK